MDTAGANPQSGRLMHVVPARCGKPATVDGCAHRRRDDRPLTRLRLQHIAGCIQRIGLLSHPHEALCPRQTVKRNDFVPISLREWAFAGHESSEQRHAALTPSIRRYNWQWPHSALIHQRPGGVRIRRDAPSRMSGRACPPTTSPVGAKTHCLLYAGGVERLPQLPQEDS
jgi:hypothetical protein